MKPHRDTCHVSRLRTQRGTCHTKELIAHKDTCHVLKITIPKDTCHTKELNTHKEIRHAQKIRTRKDASRTKNTQRHEAQLHSCSCVRIVPGQFTRAFDQSWRRKEAYLTPETTQALKQTTRQTLGPVVLNQLLLLKDNTQNETSHNNSLDSLALEPFLPVRDSL